MPYQRQFDWSWDDYATTDESSGYKVAVVLPAGFIWRIDNMFVVAKTTYAAVDTNYQTFTLYDSSGNGICSIANGPATGGLAIGPTVTTGTTSTMTTAYKYIDCSSAGKTVYIGTAATGGGRAMLGIRGSVLATPFRAKLANVS